MLDGLLRLCWYPPRCVQGLNLQLEEGQQPELAEEFFRGEHVDALSRIRWNLEVVRKLSKWSAISDSSKGSGFCDKMALMIARCMVRIIDREVRAYLSEA